MTTSGYGSISIYTYGTQYAHNWASHVWNNTPLQIPKGSKIIQLCKERLCVNPEHLELVEHYVQERFKLRPLTNREVKLIQAYNDNILTQSELVNKIGHGFPWIEKMMEEYSYLLEQQVGAIENVVRKKKYRKRKEDLLASPTEPTLTQKKEDKFSITLP